MGHPKDLTHRDLSILQDTLYDRLSDDSEAADLWYKLQSLKAEREEQQAQADKIEYLTLVRTSA